VGADEEDLFNVGFLPAHGVDTILELRRLSGYLPLLNFMSTGLASDLAVFGNLGVYPRGLGLSPGAKGWDKLDTAFVEGQSMAEVQNGIVRTGKWQMLRNQSDRLHGVPTGERGMGNWPIC